MMENPLQPSVGYAEEEIHLQDYIEVLVRRRKVFAFTFLAVFVAIAFYTFLSAPLYEASTTLHVRDEKIKDNGLLDDLGLSRDNPVQTEIEILRSRSNVEEVVRRLHLDRAVSKKSAGFDFTLEEVVRRLHLDRAISKKSAGLDFTLREFDSTAEEPVYHVVVTGPQTFEVRDEQGGGPWPGRSGARLQQGGLSLLLDLKQGVAGDEFVLEKKPFNSTVQGLRSGIKASEVGKGTNIIRISYRHTDPNRARSVTNTLVEVYLERNVALKSQEANKSVEFIGRQLDTVRKTLDVAEKELAAYKSSTGIVQMNSEAASLVDLMSETEKEWAAVQLAVRQAGFAIEALKKAIVRGASYAPGVFFEDPVVAAIAEKLTTLEMEKHGLLVGKGKAHPQVRALQDQIGQLQRKLLTTYQAMERGLSKKAADLKNTLLGYEARLKKLPAVEQDLARLMRRAQVNSEIYTFLLQKHEEARIVRAATISSIAVIDPAIAPEQPVKPKKAKNLLLGTIVGLMLGVGLAFFQEYLDDTVKDAEGVKKVSGYPVLAAIPRIAQKDTQDGDGPQDRTLVAHLDPRSVATEAFRNLRTAVHFSGLKRGKQVVLATSSFSGEGKTTVAVNLATVLAQAGSRVLLVGCDLRKPSLHELFGQVRSAGLTELLAGDAQVGEAIVQTKVPGLHLVGSGAIPPNPAELLGSEQMGSFIEAAKKRYDHIILDAPPFLAVTDSALLSRLANMVLVIMEAGRVPAKVARHLQESLQSCEAPVSGVVLNDKAGKAAGYYGGYGYGYGRYGFGYGYRYGEEEQQATKRSWRQKLIARLRGRA